MPNIKSYTNKKNETLYMFQIYIKTDEITGKPIKTTRRGFKTKKEAMQAQARIQLNLDEITPAKAKRTPFFKEVYKLWFEQHQLTVKENTLKSIECHFNNHILPKFGKLQIDEININLCQKAVNDWFSRFKSFKIFVSYTKNVLEFALKQEIIDKNPMKLVTIPKRVNFQETEKVKFLEKEELIQLLNCAKKVNFQMYSLFRLLAFSGIRKGEALALTWQDVFVSSSELNINKTIAYNRKNKIIVHPPKSKSSIRIIPLDKITLDTLLSWKQQQETELAMFEKEIKPDYEQLLFPYKNNTFLELATPNYWLEVLSKKHNLKKITPHCFRHTHCSLLFEAGVSIEKVKARLGHSDIKTTMNIYTHVSKKSKEETAEIFGSFMNF